MSPFNSIRALALTFISALALVVLPSTSVAQAVSVGYHFQDVGESGQRPLFGPGLLTETERAYLRALPEVRVAISKPDFRPYEILGEGGEISGVHVDILVRLARAYGLRLRPVVFERFSDALDAAKLREVDLLMSLCPNRERGEYLEFTLGATPMGSAMFTRRGETLSPEAARFAVVQRNIAADFVQRRYPQARVIEAQHASDALALLSAGRADIHVANLLPTLDVIGRERIDALEVSQLVQYGSGHYHFAVRKDWAPLVRILNCGIGSLRTQTPSQLAAAMAAKPASMLAPPFRAPSPHELTVLQERPVWRHGAVRGLTLLNDVDGNGRHTGIAAEYAEAVAQQLGVRLQLVPFASVADMLDALRAGQIDMVPFLTRTASRVREFGYLSASVEMPYLIVARADAPLYWNLGSLRGKRVALALQHPLRELFAAGYPEIKVVDVPAGQGAMDAVAAGSADAAVEVKFFANLRIHGDDDGHLRTTAEVPELASGFHFATSAAARPLLPLIDEALAAIVPAERERMLRRWVAQDLEPAFPWRKHLPLITAMATALLSLLGLTLWWNRRLAREVAQRRRSEQLLTDIAATMPGVAFRYVLSEGGVLKHMYVNAAARGFLGIELDPQQTVLANILPYLREDHRHDAEQRERACAASGERFRATGVFQLPGAAPRWLHSEAVCTQDACGRRVWTGFVVDVSGERELQERLAGEVKARTLLLASASHELRAPTHNLSLALQSIDERDLASAAQRSLGIARRAAQTLTQLLNDVLDAARLDAGPLHLIDAPFALRELLAELAEAWGAAAHDRGLAFVLDVAPDVPADVRGDALRLRQVLVNLLSNACKYPNKGEVRLTVRRGLDPGLITFEVRDTGAGLTEQQQAGLFQPYVTHHAASPWCASTGLGLVVCRKIVEAMGGEIGLTSATGEGSTFRVSLSLDVATPLSGPTSGAAIDRRDGVLSGAGKVVVCDDDPVCRQLAGAMLRLRGYEVIEAEDGAAALRACQRDDVSVLVTDLGMPEMNGRELIAAVRAAEAKTARRVYVVVCSGSLFPQQEQDVETALVCDAYLHKPLVFESLIQVLRSQGGRPAAMALAAPQLGNAGDPT